MQISSSSSIESQLEESIGQYLRDIEGPEDASHIQLHGTGAVQRLELKLREHYGVRRALCVSNCTTGLLAVALALNLRNREVLVPPLLYGASISGLLLLGNRLRFCDVDPETLTLDPNAVRNAVGRNTRAIVGVDLFGVPCDSPGLRQVADECGLHYISDCAQSFGASRHGRPSGSEADACVVSFTSGKVLFAGEGGAVVTNSEDLYRRLLWLTQHPHRQRREIGLTAFNEVNLNGRIHPLCAIWADTVFAASLSALRKWQQSCFRLIACINAQGMTEPINFEQVRIFPSFFRITAAMRKDCEPQHLTEALAGCGFRVDVRTSPINPIFQSPVFQQQFARRVSGTELCRVAEEQTARRISIHFRP
jgi:dTDP-4-amino-4,6-dideoxygalactose transaminase